MHPLLDRIERHADSRPAHLAARDPAAALTYAQFRAAAAGLAGRIEPATQKPRIGIVAPTSVAAAVAIHACWYAGRQPVPLNFLLAPAELAAILRDAELDLILTTEHFAALVAQTGCRTVVLGPETMAPGAAQVPQVSGADVAAVIYTSGTAGEPKGVCLSFDNLAQNVQACATAAELGEDEVFLGVLPQFHAYGLTTTTLLPLALGASAHFVPRFTPIGIVGLIADQRVTVFITVASMFNALAAMKDARREQFASLTHPVSGGEPLSLKTAHLFEERFGKRIYEGYGMTEASPVVAWNTPRACRLGSVGRPLPGVSVAAMDERGCSLPPGSAGELVVRGHCVMRGYLNKPAQTAVALRDGVLHTGDIGRLDGDGFVYITGRAKDMLIVGGENVFPAEIEAVLTDFPGVADAAVIGVPDAVRGEVPVAFVIPAVGVQPEPSELRSFCRTRLAGYKVPREIRIHADLPRSATGKILKRALYGLYN